MTEIKKRCESLGELLAIQRILNKVRLERSMYWVDPEDGVQHRLALSLSSDVPIRCGNVIYRVGRECGLIGMERRIFIRVEAA